MYIYIPWYTGSRLFYTHPTTYGHVPCIIYIFIYTTLRNGGYRVPTGSLFFLSFSLSLFFVGLRVPLPVPFSFVLSFRLVVFRLVSCIAFFAFLFASLLSLVADSVILVFRLGATPPPPLLTSLMYACSPCVLSSVFFLASSMLIYCYCSSLPSLF